MLAGSRRGAFPHPPFRAGAALFAFQWQPVPYLLHDLILTSLVAAFGTAAGGVVFNELLVLALPCALLYYAHVNKLAPRHGR